MENNFIDPIGNVYNKYNKKLKTNESEININKDSINSKDSLILNNCCTNGKDNGKIGLFESIKSFFKGVVTGVAVSKSMGTIKEGSAAAASQGVDDAMETVVQNSDDALKAGHELGKSMYRDGKWYTFDKTANQWLEDTKIAESIKNLDDTILNEFKDTDLKAVDSTNDTESNISRNYKNGNLSETEWEEILDDEYHRVRGIGKYSKKYTSNINGSIENLQAAVNNPYSTDIGLVRQGVWNYRLCKNIPAKELGERMSLNVKGDSRLIKELDMLMNEGQYIDDYGRTIKINVNDFYYKTYEDVSKWALREDPITLYCKGDFNSETLKAIEQITKKYVRGSLNGASSSATPWMLKEINPQSNLIYNLIMRASEVNKNLASVIAKQASNQNGFILSAGQYRAFVNILNEYLKYMQTV